MKVAQLVLSLIVATRYIFTLVPSQVHVASRPIPVSCRSALVGTNNREGFGGNLRANAGVH
jgi:hypothetical protein